MQLLGRLCLFAIVLATSGCGGAKLSSGGDAGVVAETDASLPQGGGEDLASAAPGDAASAPLPDCACFAGDGVYCATAIATYGAQHHCSAPGLAQHGGDLYRCAAGKWTVETVCGAAGCYVAPPNMADGCHVAGATKTLWVVFSTGSKARDLAGMFQCLLARTNFNDLARQYPNGYGLKWGASINANCAQNDYACAVAALGKAGFTVADHDVIELVLPGYCGGDNNARNDGVLVGNVRVRGANVGDCGGTPTEERVAVHEAFESCGHWANGDCCTGEVNPAACPDNGEAFCPDCPCTCGRYQSDGSYGGYTLDCGGGKTYYSQRVPTSAKSEFDPNACAPFTLTH